MSYKANAAAVLIGGAAGAVCRFALNAAITERVLLLFPLGILCVNILGCFLMGLLQGGMRRAGVPFAVGYSLLGTGFLGGFTTFSSFALDTLNLYQGGSLFEAGLNIALNAALCLGAVWAGWALLAPRRATAAI